MAILAADTGGGDYQPVPQGTHDATCYKIVDAGTSINEYQGERKSSIAFSFSGSYRVVGRGRPTHVDLSSLHLKPA